MLPNNFPYTATNPGECTHWNDPHVHFQGWNRSQCNDIEGIKYAILNYGPGGAAVFTTTGFTNYPEDTRWNLLLMPILAVLVVMILKQTMLFP